LRKGLDILLFGSRKLPLAFSPPLTDGSHEAISDILPLQSGHQLEYGWRRKIDWDNSGRTRRGYKNYVLFQYTLKGGVNFRFEGRETMVHAGQALFLPLPHESRYWLPEDGEWEWLWVAFTGDTALKISREIVSHAGPVLDIGRSESPIRLLQQIFAEACDGESPSPFHTSALLYRFLMELSRMFLDRQPAYPPAVSRALAEFRQRPEDPDWNLDTLAQAAGLSKYHFARLFRQTVGLTPGNYLTESRMKRAMELLSFTQLPIKQIAALSGFRGHTYFCAAFKKHYGYSPGACRYTTNISSK